MIISPPNFNMLSTGNKQILKISGESSSLLKKMAEQGDVCCSGLFLSARFMVFSQVATSGQHLLVLPDKESAEYCAADLYSLIDGDKVFFLPESGKLVERSNYRATLQVQRTSAISRIVEYKEDENNDDNLLVIVSYPEALEEGVPSGGKMKNAVFKLKKGEEVSHDEIRDRLFENGFERVDFVSEPGQFAVRGGIIDIFSYSYNYPYRLSFFGDEIESISVFDCNTQLSKEKTDEVEIYPDIMEEGDGNVGIDEILSEDCRVWLDSSDLYCEREFFKCFETFKKVYLQIPLRELNVYSGEGKKKKGNENVVKFSISPQPPFNKNFELLTADIRKRVEEGYRVVIFSEKESQIERIRTILLQNGGIIPEFCSGKTIHNGFIDNEDKVCCYSDHEIFDRYHRVSVRRTVEKSGQLTINDLNSFRVGDYVVHINHGVGIFGGLVKLNTDKGQKEVVKLIYKDGDEVFISVHALHKISRFKSKDSEPPRINKLGSKAWQAVKSNAKSRVKDIAKELIQLYAKRKASKGFAFSPDTYLSTELESSFMYEDTPDQEKATADVKRDMEDDCPMDRLLCGDVGFGKTEVAVRAAFKAVADSKQVAVLVPTTILALQHYTTFTERLKDMPCTVEYVSRLRTPKQISDIQERLKRGAVDILVGTHKILGAGFEFKDLGLLVIDEEQKFGVGAKEKLRQLKANVDTLTLTATPIPRTLQFSLLGARDLSIINTPPPNRIPIQTEIILFDGDLIRKAINYELSRGGQIFFVHNRVEELESIREILQGLVPDMKICVSHGQMPAKELENKILDFMAGDYDLLLCTTIIENGLDIPNANTIIINQAQNVGLSDLHQLRGRVGRSNRKAFCYLVVPPLPTMTDEARRRLQAIEAFSDLGSGFSIAMQDLDIRGSGNLLGAEQSGFISDIGYETYQKILAEAMDELGLETGIRTKRDDAGFKVECTIETDEQAFIPDSYINVPTEKIRVYKELDAMPDRRTVEQFRERLIDRFGPLPQEAESLFNVVKVRQIGEKLGFEKLIVKNGILIAFFVSNPLSGYYKSKTFERIIERVNAKYPLYELKQNNDKLRIVVKKIDSIAKAISVLEKLL